MDILRKLFPLSFKYSDSIGSLIVGILIYLVGAAVVGAVIGLLPYIPVVGKLISLLSYLIGLYSTVGIVVEILAFLGVLK